MREGRQSHLDTGPQTPEAYASLVSLVSLVTAFEDYPATVEHLKEPHKGTFRRNNKR